jgi:putative aldouronate transport system permease protein
MVAEQSVLRKTEHHPKNGLQRLWARTKHHMFRRNLAMLIMTLPGLAWIILFKYVTLGGLLIAFERYRPRDGIFGSEWVGLKNFEYLFSTDIAWRATRNTLLLNLIFIIGSIIFTLFISALIFEVYSSKLTRYYQTIMLLPFFISWIIGSYFVFILLSHFGIINSIAEQMGNDPVAWYREPRYWPSILLMVVLWKGTGFGTLIYLAGMIAINPQLYEAAQLDGAGRFQRFLRITLPLIMPLVTIQLLLRLSHIFNADFGLFFQVTRNQTMLYEATDVLDTFIYRSLVQVGNVGMSAAAGLYQSLVGFTLVLFANWIVRRLDSEGDKALF